jgi:hypothetical protein
MRHDTACWPTEHRRRLAPAGATHDDLHRCARCSVLAGGSRTLPLPTGQGVLISHEGGSEMATTAYLVARSGDLKGELVRYAQQPRYHRAFREALLSQDDAASTIVDE